MREACSLIWSAPVLLFDDKFLWFGVTANPTAEWIANQVTEACGWQQTPRYLICDRDVGL